MERCYEVLIKSFERTQFIEYDNVMFGWSKSAKLGLLNEYDYDLLLEINCKADSITLLHNGDPVKGTKIKIPQFDRYEIQVVWKPETVGKMAETLDFKARGIRVQTKLIGCCIEAKKQKSKGNKENVQLKQPKIAERTKIEKMTNVENDKRMTKSDNYVSEIWLKDQEDLYKKFLNTTFTNYMKRFGKEEIISNILKYREYFAMSWKSCQNLFERFDRQIEKDTFIMKDEVLFRRNTAYHNRLGRIIFCYNPLWLFFGLEVVMGLKLDENLLDVDNENRLKSFVMTRFLWADEIAKGYNLKVDKMLRVVEFEKKLSRHLMKNVFKLIFILDTAKYDNVLPREVSLFKSDVLLPESGTLSSENLLQNFSDTFLKNESNLVKKLTASGPKLQYTENALCTLDFSVFDLAKDLADGLRLVKLASILTKDDELLSQVRYPPADNIRKQHNITLAMSAFRDKGGVNMVTFSGGKHIDVESICNGHREKTLALMWCIVARYHVTELIDKARLMQELTKLKHHNSDSKPKRVLGEICSNNNNGSGGGDALSVVVVVRGDDSMNNVELLVAWVKLVNNLYFHNLDTTTSNNSAPLLDENQLTVKSVCVLVHYYLPHLIPLNLIIQCMKRNQHQEDGHGDSVWMELFRGKMNSIGGIPVMSFTSKHSLLSTLAFLSNRLFDLFNQSQAALVIQRSYRFHRYMAKYQCFLHHIICIQAHVRGYIARQMYKCKLSAILKLQTSVRRMQARRRFCHMKHSAIVIQKYWRRHKCRDNYVKLKRCSIVIQTHFRRYYNQKIYSAAVTIQKQWKMYIVRRQFMNQKNAANTIRKYFLMASARTRFLELKWAAVVLQSNYRYHRDRSRYLALKRACVSMQALVRMKQAKHKYKIMRRGFCRLQALVKMHREHRRFLALKQATICIQSYVRRWHQLRQYKSTLRNIVAVQKRVRSHQCRQRFVLLKTSAIRIQKTYRGYLQKKRYVKMRRSAITIQRYIRGYLVHKLYIRMKECAVVIQKNYRRHKAMRWYQYKVKCVVRLQSFVRGHQARRYFLENRQTMVRDRQLMLLRIEQERSRLKATRQTMMVAVSQFSVLLYRARRRIWAVNVIQRWWRGFVARSEMSSELTEVRCRLDTALRNHSQCRTMSFIGEEALLKLQTIITTVITTKNLVGTVSPVGVVSARMSRPDDTDPVASFLYSDRHNNKPAASVVLSGIMTHLLDLEKVTRLSKEMCEAMQRSDLFDKLLTLIRHCNRGEADLEVVSVAIAILINLGRARLLSLLTVSSNHNEAANMPPPEIVKFCADQLKRHVNGRRGSKAITVFCRAGLLLVLLNQAQEQAAATATTTGNVKTTEHVRVCYRMSHDSKLCKFVAETKEHLCKQWNNSNQHSKLHAGKLVEEMKLSPYWDLSRSNYPDVKIIGIKSGSKTSSNTTTTKSVSASKSTTTISNKLPEFKKPRPGGGVGNSSSTVTNDNNYNGRLLGRSIVPFSSSTEYGVFKNNTKDVQLSQLRASNSSLVCKSESVGCMTGSASSSLSDLPKSVCGSSSVFTKTTTNSMARHKIKKLVKTADSHENTKNQHQNVSLLNTWDLVHKYYVISLLHVELTMHLVVSAGKSMSRHTFVCM